MLHLPKLLAICLYFPETVFGILAESQSPSPGQRSPDYSKEAYVIENLRTIVSFEKDGTGNRETSARIRVQAEPGVRRWGLLRFGYSSASEQVDVRYVRVRKPDGRVIETAPESIQDMPAEITLIAPMYSDYREKHIAVKGLVPGDLLEFDIQTRSPTSLIPGQFWFNYDFERDDIALNEELEVRLPKDRYINVKSPDTKPSLREEGGRRVYSWKSANLERRGENQAAERETPPPAVEISTFRSWDELGSWWGGLERERAAPTPEIRARALELIKDAKTDAEKLRAIYNYVATKFRYVSLSFGIGRFQPHAAAEVLNNAYGDCKDKHTLLASLLDAAGMQAFPVLINTTRKIDPDVPSPGQFDHVISVVSKGKDLIWLDTTTEVAPLGFLTANLRGKQALVIFTGKPASLAETPVDSPLRNSLVFEIEGKLDESGTLEAGVQRSDRGDLEVALRAAFRRTPQPQWKDFVQSLSYAFGFGGEVSDVTVTVPESTGQPLRISYKYIRKEYSDWANRRISPPLQLCSLLELSDKAAKSEVALKFGGPGEYLCKSKIAVPKGYAPHLLPPVDISRDFAEYHSTYSFKDGVFEAERRLAINVRELPSSRREDYRSLQKAVTDDGNLYTSFENRSELASTTSPNPEAASLVEQAREAFQRRDLNAAADSLERAVKLDERYKEAWLTLGTLRMAQNHTNEGAAALRKAIELDPKDSRAYKALGFGYMALNRREEAISVWRDLLEQDPNEKDAHANLGNILLGLKRYSEAVPELEAAVALNKPSSRLELELGNSYLGAGNNQKAVGAYLKAAEMDLHPGIWNEVAYTLADHNLSLPEAQHYAEMAVKSVENDAARVSLDKLDGADLERMTQLASLWDTLGWVYFRQGFLQKAQSYLYSAWNLAQTLTIGDHLGQLYEKLGKKQAAIDTYSMALATMGFPDDDARGKIRSRLVRLVGNTATADATVRYETSELSKMRRAKLGRVSARSGSAEFWVLLAPGGKVEEVKFISGAPHLRSQDKTVASLNFKAPLPDDAPTKLVRRGVLVCQGMNLGCDFTLFTPDVVRSTN